MALSIKTFRVYIQLNQNACAVETPTPTSKKGPVLLVRFSRPPLISKRHPSSRPLTRLPGNSTNPICHLTSTITLDGGLHTTCWGRVYVPRTRTYNTASNRLQGLRQMEMVNVPNSDCGLRSTPVCPYSIYRSSERHGANDSPTSRISRPHQVPGVPAVAEIGAEIKGANRKIRHSLPCNPHYRSPTERLRLLASPPLNYHQD